MPVVLVFDGEVISGIEKFYCKSRLHARIWRYIADRIFPEFLPFFPISPVILEIGTGQGGGSERKKRRSSGQNKSGMGRCTGSGFSGK